MKLWIFNHLPSNHDFNWISLSCRDNLPVHNRFLRWINQLVCIESEKNP